MNTIDVQYHSSWEALPAIFDQIMDGVEDEQRYLFRKYGSYQGSVRVKLASRGSYYPMIGSSGSLEAACVASEINRFVSNQFFNEYFGLNQPALKSCLKETFFCLLKGKTDQIVASDQGAVLKLKIIQNCMKGWPQCYTLIEGNHTDQLISLSNQVQSFLNRLDVNRYCGKLK